MTTTPTRPPIDLVLPPNWDAVTYTDEYVYLGILMGNSVDATMVMEAALEKFEGRLMTYLPARTRFSMANRVRIANIYLIPIFSYLYKFFLMTELVATRIEKGLRTWLIRGNCTNLDRLRAPTHQVGLAGPLVNHRHLNSHSPQE